MKLKAFVKKGALWFSDEKDEISLENLSRDLEPPINEDKKRRIQVLVTKVKLKHTSIPYSFRPIWFNDGEMEELEKILGEEIVKELNKIEIRNVLLVQAA